MLNEDLKKSRENGQHGDSKTSSKESDLSLLIVLGISVIGGLIAFCCQVFNLFEGNVRPQRRYDALL